jgi:hypothetical protein
VLEDDDGIGFAKCCAKHAPCVSNRRRRDDTNTGNMCKPVLEAVGMLSCKLAPRPRRHADHQRDRELATRHVPQRCCRIDDLVQREKAEVHRHDLDDRPHAPESCAYPGAGESLLGQRRIPDAFLAKLGQEALRATI